MLSSEKSKVILCLFILLACLAGIIRVANAAETPTVLMFGLELKDLDFAERQRFAHYTVLERSYMNPNMVKDIVKQAKPVSVIIRQPSGGAYEYSADGTLVKQVTLIDPRQNVIAEQRQGVNNPQFMGQGSLGSMTLSPGMQVPIQINGQMQIGYPNGQISTMQPVFGQQQTPPPLVVKDMVNYGSGCPGCPPNLMQRPPQMASYNPNNSIVQPFPGANVPNNWYPGTSMYSYLPGEGDVLPPPAISTARQALKQAASAAQNNSYPFWFDSYLTTDTSNLNSINTSSIPSLQFSSNTTSNPAIVGGQWIGTGIGIGSTLLDTYLEGAELKARREGAMREAYGTPNYYYPDAAYTRYQSLPYQLLPNSAWY
jgi:hypothetical protein